MFKNMIQQLSSFWPRLSAHRIYWERYNCALVYEYDPADDGPEVDVIRFHLALRGANETHKD